MDELNLDAVVDSLFKSEEEVNARREFDKRDAHRAKVQHDYHQRPEIKAKSQAQQTKVLRDARRSILAEEEFRRSEEGYGLP